jgi:hypothetical protein
MSTGARIKVIDQNFLGNETNNDKWSLPSKQIQKSTPPPPKKKKNLLSLFASHAKTHNREFILFTDALTTMK